MCETIFSSRLYIYLNITTIVVVTRIYREIKMKLWHINKIHSYKKGHRVIKNVHLLKSKNDKKKHKNQQIIHIFKEKSEKRSKHNKKQFHLN